MIQAMEVMSQERLDRYIEEAARAVGYEEGFGIMGCDLSQSHWWAAYTRQSLKEQAENDRLAEYLLTCARLAKQASVIVAREYVIYDADSSEDFNRPGMIRLRGQLIAGRHIAGTIIPSQGRLSMDPLHQLTFEKECDYYGVQVIYGDAPGGKDWASQTTRLIQAQANALRVKCNRDNALGGNIARVLAGKVPAQKAPYGYKYRREAIIDQRGKVKVLKAWWELDELSPDGKPLWGSPAWVVVQIFTWIGNEGRTEYWVVNKLNDELGIKSPQGGRWTPTRVANIIRRKCYTGKGRYNENGRVPNPTRPLGDLTLGIPRTIVRPKPIDGKPESEKVTFNVPPLVSEELWQKANNNLAERGRGRGKQGKAIQALLRGRMLCPRCQKPMSVLRDKHNRIYYYCRAHYCRWLKNPCTYNRFVSVAWDDEVWEEVCGRLRNDAWVEQQLTAELSQNAEVEKLVKLEHWKINQAKAQIVKAHEGWEKEFYTDEEVMAKLAKHRESIARAEAEICRLQAEMTNRGLSPADAELLRQELKALRDHNLAESTFGERLDLVAKLGIRVLPSEDLKSRKIFCRLNLLKVAGEREQKDFAKVMFGSPFRIKGKTFEKTFALIY